MTRHWIGHLCLYLSVLIFFVPAPSAAKSYKGHKLLSVETDTADQLNEIHSYSASYPGVTLVSDPVKGQFKVVVAPESMDPFVSKVTELDVWVRCLNDDIQTLIDATTKRATVSRRAVKASDSGVIDHTMYHTYPDINTLLETLASQNPDLLELSTLTFPTHEGRNVTLVKLHGAQGERDTKPAIVVEAGIHAREWISPAVNLWLIEELIGGYKTGDPEKTMMLDDFDWYIIPVTNPDGYQYTHSEDRLWRKNRRYIERDCQGVDLNRNFDIEFNTTGVSSYCGDTTYPGHKPFSEPETSNVKALVESVADRLVSFLSIHSFSQLILTPWGYSEVTLRPDNWKELDRVAGLMQDEIRRRHGTEYEMGTAYNVIGYAASGAAEDWALLTNPGIFAICIELRPRHDDPRGFLLPPEEIIPAAEEYVDSLTVMARELAKRN